MNTWLYQLNAKHWSPKNFRHDIWEGRRWYWEFGQKRGAGSPEPGDVIVFYYARTGNPDPGVYGWAVVDSLTEEHGLYFTPCAPTNWLKMDPWQSDELAELVKVIRGQPQATLFLVKDRQHVLQLRRGVRKWLAGD